MAPARAAIRELVRANVSRGLRSRGGIAAAMTSSSHRPRTQEQPAMSNEPFETITDQLARAWGGVNMKLTQYGYPNDPYSDSETRKGHGAYHNLHAGESVALTDSGLRALGLSRHQVRSSSQWVDIKLRGGGTLTRRIDDRAPERDLRTDLYQPGGFDRNLPDHADISLHR
jgi:hypothetical protein